ncbi:MAG: PaaI family thioesterase [Rhodobacteraceae bacterium]|nr:PaaI family thioesterase [Paracoccaceae bacterium]
MPDLKFAASLQELMSIEQVRSMSGLEFLQGIIDGKYPAPPMAKALNFRIHAIERGIARFRGVPEFDYCNPLGTVHGGWYGAILDSAMACAIQTLLDKGAVYTTLEYKINITRSIPLGTEVECTGTVQHFGRKTGVSEGRIIGIEDGKTYATGSTTCIILPS